ncbi:MAG: phytanoyl-CoA dioxygenase family protein [Dongiaceae bacterium]
MPPISGTPRSGRRSCGHLDLFRGLLGPDLLVQRRPYLRCVRPGRPEDAAPLHRDTYYGASPYELSAVVPLVEMPAAAAIAAIPGSHLEPDAAYPYRQLPGDAGLIGTPRHRLGYPYAPRLLDPALEARTVRVPVALGEAMLFGLSLVHGGGVNDGAATRFSIDVRVVNALAPVRIGRGVDTAYFVPLCASPISRSAQRYLAANQPADQPAGEAPEPP